MKKLIAVILFTFTLSLFTNLCEAQIGINNSAVNPDASAILDLKSGNAGVNKGFLAPQVALTNVTIAAPVTSPATGLIIYTTTAPTGGNGIGYYYWNGSLWSSLGTSPALLNLTQGTGITSFIYNGTGAATVSIANTGVVANSYGNTSTYPTFTVNAQGQLTVAGTQPLPTSLPPSGAAGGNLSGTYPNPTVAKVNGATVPAAGALTSGNVLQVNGASSTTYGPINIAGGTNYITGNLPVANLNSGTNASSTTFWRGDGTWANPTAATLSNLTQGTGITSFSYNGSSAATVGLANTGVTAGSYGSATTVPTYTVNAQGQITGAANVTITSSSGTVTNFSAGTLSPLFTTSVANSTTTPALTFTLTHAAAYTILGNNTGASAAPAYFTPVLASSLFENQGYIYSVLHGNGSGAPYWGAVDLTTDVSNNLPVTNLNSGSGASSNTFWRGDGTWATPSGGSINGSGTNGYLALWTPNSTTLGTSVVQDDGAEVGIGTAPAAGLKLSVYSPTGYTGRFNDGNGDYVNLSSTLDAIAIEAYGTYQGAYISDVHGDYTYLADGASGAGISAYGSNYGGKFQDNSGDYGYIGDNANGYGINASGATAGGYFTDGNGDYTEAATGGYGLNGSGTQYGIYAIGNGTAGGYFKDGGSEYSYSAHSGFGTYSYGPVAGGNFSDPQGDNLEAATGGYGLYSGGTSAGGYLTDNATNTYISYAGYGILSSGVKSTMVKDKNNQNRVLYCNESPEVMFEDYGEGQLVNGKAHITIDSLLAMNVAINEKHPLRVYIELLGDCNGTYVTNRSASGFDVNELNHGASNTAFQWHIICNRASTVNNKGETYDYANWRFPVGPDTPKKLNPSAPANMKATN